MVGCCGCGREGSQAKDRRRLVEDLFEMNSLEVFAVGWRYQSVRYRLREGIAPEYAAAEIAAYLLRRPNCRETEFSLDEVAGPLCPAIHPRDFWAMVLADIKHIEFSISAMRPGPNDEDIAALLERVNAQRSIPNAESN
jgi:hypothetical protein